MIWTILGGGGPVRAGVPVFVVASSLAGAVASHGRASGALLGLSVEVPQGVRPKVVVPQLLHSCRYRQWSLAAQWCVRLKLKHRERLLVSSSERDRRWLAECVLARAAMVRWSISVKAKGLHVVSWLSSS